MYRKVFIRFINKLSIFSPMNSIDEKNIVECRKYYIARLLYMRGVKNE